MMPKRGQAPTRVLCMLRNLAATYALVFGMESMEDEDLQANYIRRE